MISMHSIISFSKNEIVRARFLDRINRFVGRVATGGRDFLVHIHDPGRIPLLTQHTDVLLLRREGSRRKTKYDLLAFRYRDEWIFSNSLYHSQIFEETISKGLVRFKGEARREVKIYGSRIDFLIGSTPVEVKGCTWIRNDSCFFPDAPTARGARHLEDLARYVIDNGLHAFVVFLVFSKYPKCLRIARDIDPYFYNRFREALSNGVGFLAYKYTFKDNSLYFVGEIPVKT